MRVLVTLDHVDGSKSKQRKLDLDGGTSMQELIFMLMERGVCGCTITKTDILKQMKHMEGEDDAV